MPKTLQYKTGSVIYFQGDAADDVYALRTGSVSLVYQNIENGNDIHDLVEPGEFFGVRAALGRYPREENALVLQDTSVIAMPVSEFEALAMEHISLSMKMLKVFSKQLRRFHQQVSELLVNQVADAESGLFSVGMFYFQNKRYPQAKYVFSRYLTYYPAGKHALEAAKNLEIVENALIGIMPEAPATARHPLPLADLSDTAAAYYDAVGIITHEHYQQAYDIFKRIVEADQDAEYTAKSVFEIGRCLFLLNKFEECIQHFTSMITRYPKHPDLEDALFFIGQSHERMSRKAQAATFYKKILAMAANEDEGVHVKAKWALKALEE